VDTDWRRAFELGDNAGEPDSGQLESEREEGFFGRLRGGLARSREALGRELSASLFDRIYAQTWERLEEALILADVGPATTATVVGRLEGEVAAGRVTGSDAVRARLVDLLAEVAQVGERRIDLRARPAVVMVVGVNGTGKTTTIGKLAWHIQRELGLEVLLAAGDTYRAAAVEQLVEWSVRAGCEIVRAEQGGDPGAVAYDAIESAKSRGFDVVICDTAGRLHTHGNLMEELAKVRRVISKQIPEAPNETLIVIDATTGQNGLRQAKAFTEAVELTGVVLTKLDGSAKGGVALAIASELGTPVKLIGIGEALEDLRPFDPDQFARALLGEESP
jgi:fused signal recognition particle receptor